MSWSRPSVQRRPFKTGGCLLRYARYFIIQVTRSPQTGRKPRQSSQPLTGSRSRRSIRSPLELDAASGPQTRRISAADRHSAQGRLPEKRWAPWQIYVCQADHDLPRSPRALPQLRGSERSRPGELQHRDRRHRPADRSQRRRQDHHLQLRHRLTLARFGPNVGGEDPFASSARSTRVGLRCSWSSKTPTRCCPSPTTVACCKLGQSHLPATVNDSCEMTTSAARISGSSNANTMHGGVT
jgi:hypothetical protein